MADIESNIENNSFAGSHPAALAYAQIADEIAAVPDDDLIAIRTDVVTAVTVVLGSLPEVRALRPEIEEALRKFDLERFDKLEVYARALHHADVLWRAASMPKAEVAKFASELSDARDMLSRSADALVAHGLIEAERLKEIKKQPGYRPIATDVATIVEVIRERWNVVKGKTPLTLADLDAYASRALDLLAAVGTKEQAPTTVGEAASNRNGAFTLFVRAYEDARRAVLYLRPKDGDQIAPSLYAGRGGRGSGDAPSSEPDSERPTTTPNGSGASPALRINNPTGLPATAPLTS